MNRDRHMSYQYRIGNRKGGNDTVRLRLGLDHTTLPQGLSYRGSKGEGHRKKIYLGRFPYLQGRLAPQASYNISASIPAFIGMSVLAMCHESYSVPTSGQPWTGHQLFVFLHGQLRRTSYDHRHSP